VSRNPENLGDADTESHPTLGIGLFTMIVLGESIVVLTSGVVETSWRPVSALPR